ncbi:hypothetical protein HanIR_Chr14g0709161 [Helianthus annuus]|nr:hypothetical protein HanIR_Chr14g0709161 [Helianthus annuus]
MCNTHFHTQDKSSHQLTDWIRLLHSRVPAWTQISSCRWKYLIRVMITRDHVDARFETIPLQTLCLVIYTLNLFWLK